MSAPDVLFQSIKVPATPELEKMLSLPPISVPNVIVTVKNRVLSPVAQLFIEQAREVAKPLAKHKR
jgi:hypothetical protein